MIRVFVVDDSATVRGRLVELVSEQADMVVCGQAANGRDAIEQIMRLKPDVITLDLALPEIDGLGVTEHVMAVMPTPILIVSASFNRGEVFNTYEALSAGAVDVLDKSADADDEWAQRFVSTVRIVSRIKVITHPRGRLRTLAKQTTTASSTSVSRNRAELVAIGASTGGPGAIVDVLAGMPKQFALPILVVLHVDASFASSFADWLGQRSGRTVRIPNEGDLVADAGGQVLFAPPHRHLTIVGGRARLVDGPPRHHCKPSVDVLFESLAADRGARTVAALLTGMGRDGAAGLLAIRRAGGHTVAQDEMSSVVYGMPREAALIGAADRILPLPEIGAALALAAGGTE
ncbi:MAG TPA: chemotaxis-specific protein-glutamate methyltransferase CheB [Kofleriaceae bacterium]|jgi:two-component system chemotaxis response regulator CheB